MRILDRAAVEVVEVRTQSIWIQLFSQVSSSRRSQRGKEDEKGQKFLAQRHISFFTWRNGVRVRIPGRRTGNAKALSSDTATLV